MNLTSDFVFSQSSLQSYLNCQYQFYLKYARQLDWPSALLDPLNAAEIERQSGIRFHQLVYNYFLGVPETDLIRQGREDANPKMTEWLGNFLKSGLFSGDETAYPELSVNASLESFLVSGKFDLLLLDGEKILIFDWKTSKRPPQSEWLRKRVQTQLYPLLARSLHQSRFPGAPIPKIRFTYWEASFPEQSIQFDFEPSDLQRSQGFIIQLASEITSKPLDSFDKTLHTERCAYCLFRTYCQRPETDSYNSELENELLFTEQYVTDIKE